MVKSVPRTKQRRFCHGVAVAFALCAGFFPALVGALSSDREQPIHIEADRLDVDDVKGIGTYSGNVKYTQGTLLLYSDELVIHFDQTRTLERVEARGEPARFSQRMDRNHQVVRGQAEQIDYRAKEKYILFSGDAHFWQCDDEFQGNKVEYFADQEVVKARMAEEGQERVQVILQPRAQENKEDPCVNSDGSAPPGWPEDIQSPMPGQGAQ